MNQKAVRDEEPIYPSVEVALGCAFGAPAERYGSFISRAMSGSRGYGAMSHEECIAQDALVKHAMREYLSPKDLCVIQALFDYSLAASTNSLVNISREARNSIPQSVPIEFVLGHVVMKWTFRLRDVGTLESWSQKTGIPIPTLGRRRRELTDVLNDWRAGALRSAKQIMSDKGWIR